MVMEIPFILYHLWCISNKMLALIREKEGGYKRAYDCLLFMTRWITSTVHSFSAILGAVYRPF